MNVWISGLGFLYLVLSLLFKYLNANLTNSGNTNKIIWVKT